MSFVLIGWLLVILTYLSGAAGKGLSSKVQSILGEGTPVAAQRRAMLCPILVTASLNVDTSLGGLSESLVIVRVHQLF